MQLTELIAKMNNLSNDAEVACFYKSLRQDALIWEGLHQLTSDQISLELFPNHKLPLHPGTVGLIAFDKAVVPEDLYNGGISSVQLEKAMLGYEEYLLTDNPVVSLEKAGTVAVALIAKKQAAGNWSEVFKELLTRTRINDPENYVEFWRSILAITLNLIEERSEFLNGLVTVHTPEVAVGLLIHLVLCLPISDEDKVAYMISGLARFSEHDQGRALSVLRKKGGVGLARSAAERLLENYRLIEIEPKTTVDYWKDPFSSTKTAFKYQAVADIAQIAGDNQFAVRLNDRALEILSALVKRSKVKKAGLIKSSELDVNISDIFTEDEFSDPDIQKELVYSGTGFGVPEEAVIRPVHLIRQSKMMADAGNMELAREEIHTAFDTLSDSDFEKALVNGPDQINSWDPLENLKLLIDTGAFKEAGKLAGFLLRDNPTSIEVNQAAARAAIGREDYCSAVPFLETLTALQPEINDHKRNLGKALIAIGDLENAKFIYNKLTENGCKGDEEDLLTLGEIAMKVRQPVEALAALNTLLSAKPEHGKALTLLAIAYRENGQIDQAVERFKQAIQASFGDPQPWIELAELYWSTGAFDTAISTLKTGVSANPGNFEIQASLATKLMLVGLASEAYPLLKELSSRTCVVDVDLLLIDAMESLGMDEIEETLDKLVTRYPDEERFLANYGKRLVWKGETSKGLSLLEKAGGMVFQDSELALAYLEAACKPDYRSLAFENPVDQLSRQKTFDKLQNVMLERADDTRARLLNAEYLLLKGEVESAFIMFNELLGENSGRKSLEPARLLTGLAVTAIRSGRTEIATAALDQALYLEPDWLALQNIKAEILHHTGDDEEAVRLVLATLQSSPLAADNYIWAINFLQKVGYQENANELIHSSVEKFPQHVQFSLIKIESDLLSESNAPDQNAQDGLFDLLEQCKDSNLLERSAVVFAQLGDQDRTVYCLQKAVDFGSFSARLALAGLYRIRKDFNLALRILEQDDSNEPLIYLLKNEILYEQGRLEEIGLISMDNRMDQEKLRISDNFVPSEWMELFQSSCPEINLAFKVAMKTGEFSEINQVVQRWITDEPKNIESWVYAVETALACGELTDYERVQTNIPTDLTGIFSSQFDLLRKEKQLDTGLFSPDQVEAMELFEVINAGEPDKIARIRELTISGRFQEAETSFEMAYSVFDGGKEFPLVLQLGILRNLAKGAIELCRWADAVQLINAARTIAPKNKDLLLLDLKARTLRAEFQNRAKELGVQTHILADSTNDPDFVAEFKKSFGLEMVQKESIKRWVVRLQLALEPSQENVRAIAQLTPSDEDAAALMTGLRAIGQDKTAEQVGKNFIQHPAVLFELAICYKEEDPQKAIEYLTASLALHPHQPLAMRLFSELLETTGNLRDSVNMMENALSYWPNESRWHLDTADLWKRLGNLEKPIEHLRLASIYTPDDVEIKRSIGFALQKANKTAEALPYLLNVVQKNPTDTESWTALSEVYLKTGDLVLAEESIQKAIEIDPSAVSAYLQAGKVNWAKGELEKALDQVQLAISLDPENPDNYVFLARLYAEKSNKEKALELLEKASDCDNATVQTVIEHANLLNELNGSIAARDLIASFSQKYPENPELLMLLAEAEASCGETDKAEAVAKKVLNIQPNDKDVHMLLGRILEKNGNLDQAAFYFGQAVAIEPTYIDGYLKLSQLHIRQREYSKARRVLEQGIVNSPTDISLYLSCASLLKEVKDYRGAETMLRKASSIEPRNVLIHRQLGAILALNMVHQSQEVSTQI